ncbi:MAG: tripartite tricarboxylate transporter substrate binding protein [Betaproteobacteria bacterium]|nr:tripartite tricarboxylate transporter substrate binding protein [Betaproteobacteria bacterium]
MKIQSTLMTLVLLAHSVAQAQTWPTKPVRVIVSFTPGASIDLTARAVGQRLAENMGQPFLVENRPGGNTIVSAELAAKAPPDGYTLFMALDTTMTLVPAIYDKIPYDPIKDFVPVGQITRSSYIIVAPAKAMYRNLADMIAFARANPGKMNIGASTAFTQLLTVMLRKEAGVSLTYVPYKGGPPMIQALLAGDLDGTVDGIPLYVGLVKAGKVVPIVTTGPTRAVQFPDVPTIREAGFPQLEAPSWTAWFAPAGTPDPIVRRLNGELARVLNNAEFKQRNQEGGQNPLVHATPEEVGEQVKQGLAKWGPIVKASGIKLD